jgi:hypothetical protein
MSNDPTMKARLRPVNVMLGITLLICACLCLLCIGIVYNYQINVMPYDAEHGGYGYATDAAKTRDANIVPTETTSLP